MPSRLPANTALISAFAPGGTFWPLRALTLPRRRPRRISPRAATPAGTSDTRRTLTGFTPVGLSVADSRVRAAVVPASATLAAGLTNGVTLISWVVTVSSFGGLLSTHRTRRRFQPPVPYCMPLNCGFGSAGLASRLGSPSSNSPSLSVSRATTSAPPTLLSTETSNAVLTATSEGDPNVPAVNAVGATTRWSSGVESAAAPLSSVTRRTIRRVPAGPASETLVSGPASILSKLPSPFRSHSYRRDRAVAVEALAGVEVDRLPLHRRVDPGEEPGHRRLVGRTGPRLRVRPSRRTTEIVPFAAALNTGAVASPCRGRGGPGPPPPTSKSLWLACDAGTLTCTLPSTSAAVGYAPLH